MLQIVGMNHPDHAILEHAYGALARTRTRKKWAKRIALVVPPRSALPRKKTSVISTLLDLIGGFGICFGRMVNANGKRRLLPTDEVTSNTTW
mmetsp:Transcript_21791/g.47566  ORF Transcript_21791/g.47566 Transcript_21791/m.47566 type:complete len:92 (+) Transcript_21791:1279-1554(+)